MITGSINKIDLGTSSFERVISSGQLFVDKTRLIENFLMHNNQVSLITRQRRMGKSLNMDMLRCFLTDKEDLRGLFKGLYIENSPVWSMANSAPVFYFDFKTLTAERYQRQIYNQINKHIHSILDPSKLTGYLKESYDEFIEDPNSTSDGLLLLTEIVYTITGKRSYLLIDEYDSLLMKNYKTKKYNEIRSFETNLLSAALKGNIYLEKALLTGVMRISYESMLSGLNNIVTFDVFGDKVFTDDYGLTDEDIAELNKLSDFDTEKLRDWYNGIRIDNKPIYNIYSVMSYLFRQEYDCFWGKSGTMHMITGLLNESRRETLTGLLNGEIIETSITNRISLLDLAGNASDQAYYSLLVQAGYLALCDKVDGKTNAYLVSIPNKELFMAWRDFILPNANLQNKHRG